jgi:hypothetical protein
MKPAPEQPSDRPFRESDSLDTYLIVIEGPMDLTRRPRRASIPYTAPDAPLTNPPPRDRPPATTEQASDNPPLAEEHKDRPGDDVPPAA